MASVYNLGDGISQTKRQKILEVKYSSQGVSTRTWIKNPGSSISKSFPTAVNGFPYQEEHVYWIREVSYLSISMVVLIAILGFPETSAQLDRASAAYVFPMKD